MLLIVISMKICYILSLGVIACFKIRLEEKQEPLTCGIDLLMG